MKPHRWPALIAVPVLLAGAVALEQTRDDTPPARANGVRTPAASQSVGRMEEIVDTIAHYHSRTHVRRRRTSARPCFP